MTSAQQEFDKTYISVSEICEELQVNRSSVMHAKKKGLLPNSIDVCKGTTTLWKRAEVMEYLSAWKLAIKSRRELAAKAPR